MLSMQVSLLAPLSSLVLPVVSFLALLVTALFVAANMRTRKRKTASAVGMVGFLVLAVAILMPVFNFISIIVANVVTALGALFIMGGYVIARFQKETRSSVKENKGVKNAEDGGEGTEEKTRQAYTYKPKQFAEEEKHERRAIKEDTGLRAEPLVHLPKQKRKKARTIVTTVVGFIVFFLVGWGSYVIAERFIKPQPTMDATAPDFVFEEPSPSPNEKTVSPTPTTEEKSESEKQQNEEAEKQEKEEVPENTVSVTETETGWLNVREGASTATNIITKIDPGETYEFLEENEGGTWYKIMVDDKAGWISAKYAEKD